MFATNLDIWQNVEDFGIIHIRQIPYNFTAMPCKIYRQTGLLINQITNKNKVRSLIKLKTISNHSKKYLFQSINYDMHSFTTYNKAQKYKIEHVMGIVQNTQFSFHNKYNFSSHYYHMTILTKMIYNDNNHRQKEWPTQY